MCVTIIKDLLTDKVFFHKEVNSSATRDRQEDLLAESLLRFPVFAASYFVIYLSRWKTIQLLRLGYRCSFLLRFYCCSGLHIKMLVFSS